MSPPSGHSLGRVLTRPARLSEPSGPWPTSSAGSAARSSPRGPPYARARTAVSSRVRVRHRSTMTTRRGPEPCRQPSARSARGPEASTSPRATGTTGFDPPTVSCHPAASPGDPRSTARPPCRPGRFPGCRACPRAPTGCRPGAAGCWGPSACRSRSCGRGDQWVTPGPRTRAATARAAAVATGRSRGPGTTPSCRAARTVSCGSAYRSPGADMRSSSSPRRTADRRLLTPSLA